MATEILTAIDRDALERALVAVCRESPEDAARFEAMLCSKPWQEVGETAVYSMQCRTLRLKPWEAPPCHCRDDVIDNATYGHKRKEVALRRRLLKANLSLFEPDPIAALERVESSRRAPPAPAKSTHVV